MIIKEICSMLVNVSNKFLKKIVSLFLTFIFAKSLVFAVCHMIILRQWLGIRYRIFSGTLGIGYRIPSLAARDTVPYL